MAKYIFTYKIRCDYYDDPHSCAYTATGLGFCRSWGDAMDCLEQEYGEEMTEVLSLFLLEGESIIALPEKVVEDYKNTEFPSVAYQENIET